MPRRTIGFVKRVRFNESATPAMRLATALASVEVIALDPAITFLVGANGSGKSTLLEAIAVAAGMNAEGGGRNFRFDTSETHSALHEHITLERLGVPATDYFLRAESFYNLATALDGLGPDAYDAYGGRSLTGNLMASPSFHSPSTASARTVFTSSTSRRLRCRRRDN